jgi:hypothetical protein
VSVIERSVVPSQAVELTRSPSLEKLELLAPMRQGELRDTAAMLPVVEVSPPAG